MNSQAWATLVVGLVGVVGVLLTMRQRERADRRDQWFKRLQWGVDQADSSSQFRKEIGLEVIDYLAKSPLAGKDDFDMVERVVSSVEQRARAGRATLEQTGPDEQTGE